MLEGIIDSKKTPLKKRFGDIYFMSLRVKILDGVLFSIEFEIR
jgi:hypothetical protein